MPMIRDDGLKISYWSPKRVLKGDEPVLFIHGAGGSQFVWSFQKRFFEERFHPVIIELPGHGQAAGNGEEEIGRYADHVYRFIEAMGLGRSFLVGHSMGGAIAQVLAVNHPEILKAVVLVATGARLRVVRMILEGIRNVFEPTVRNIVRFAYSTNAPADLIEQGIVGLMACRPDVLYRDFLACDRFDFLDQVKNITVPSLVICGAEDQMTPLKFSTYLHDQIRNSRLEVIPSAGHMVMMESPDAFSQTVGTFLAEIK
jgi:pimeloyl-ACP methyl ester carboxylesterase